MARVLLVYSTVDGHTHEICVRLQRVIEAQGHSTALQEIGPKSRIDLEAADAVIIGASIRYGKHRPEVARLINEQLAPLESKPAAFFSVNAVARKPGKKSPDTNPYVRKFLRTIRWKPDIIAIFGGKIDYPRYGFFDKQMIRLIMWLTRGPTNPTGTYDFTDYEEVDAFGGQFTRLLMEAN